jgi:hypothetical protein
VLWWGTVLLVIAYPFIALANPERAPHDRWLRLRLVPR